MSNAVVAGLKPIVVGDPTQYARRRAPTLLRSAAARKTTKTRRDPRNSGLEHRRSVATATPRTRS